MLWHGLGGALLALAAAGQPAAPEDSGSRWQVRPGFEIKTHYRDSEDLALPIGFPFTADQLPPGQTAGMLRTVEPGSHGELSVVTFTLDVRRGELFHLRLKVDGVDRHDRNPTSEDRELDVDELFLRFGREAAPGRLPERRGGYVKVGKFGPFERQDDRHLESYGLISTSFNRFEDFGLELGADLHRNLYLRASYTQGNPLFLRDPNALAGDNGTEAILLRRSEGALGSGFPILYDAEIENDLDFEEPELRLGLGLRFGDRFGRHAVDLLAWAAERDLQDGLELHGTLYGGDLDLLRGPLNAFPLGIEGREKSEVGANLWVYSGPVTLFAQVVDSEVAGLDREGWEVEGSWAFELPVRWSFRGRQVLRFIAPAVRYSKLEPGPFGGSPLYPAESVRWEWEKWDLGVRVTILPGLDLTAEHADNTFVRRGVEHSVSETLVTLRWLRD